MKIREDNRCGGSSLKLSLANDDQDPCYSETKGKFNAGDLLEWSLDDLGNCSSANMNLKSTKVSLLSFDKNFCPEYLNIRTDYDNLLAASYRESYQNFRFEQQNQSLTGNSSYIF